MRGKNQVQGLLFFFSDIKNEIHEKSYNNWGFKNFRCWSLGSNRQILLLRSKVISARLSIKMTIILQYFIRRPNEFLQYILWQQKKNIYFSSTRECHWVRWYKVASECVLCSYIFSHKFVVHPSEQVCQQKTKLCDDCEYSVCNKFLNTNGISSIIKIQL